MSAQPTDLTTPKKQQSATRPSLTPSVPDSTASPSTPESNISDDGTSENVIILSYDELVERLPDAVQHFVEFKYPESVHVYLGSTGSVAEVLNYFPSHPAKGDHIRSHLSYSFIRADDLLHVYLIEVSSGNPHSFGVRMLGGLFEVWRRQSQELSNMITAGSDGTNLFGTNQRAPDLLIRQGNIDPAEQPYPRG